MKYPGYSFAWVEFCTENLPTGQRGYSAHGNWKDDYAQACHDANSGDTKAKEILEQYLLFLITQRLKE